MPLITQLAVLLATLIPMATFGSGVAPILSSSSTMGSNALLDPWTLFVGYTVDSTQIPKFGADEFGTHHHQVRRELSRPGGTISAFKGLKHFITREIAPIDVNDLGASEAMLPNYGLHLYGGGLVYRLTAEHFAATGMRWPRATAAALSMTSEYLQEVLERGATDSNDAIADFWLFRPAGIWLFSDDDRTRWIKKHLRPAVWPHQVSYDVSSDRLTNIGINYVMRPSFAVDSAHRPFVYMGITTLLGMSHRLTDGDTVSWGIGTATENVKPTDLRAAAGIFYDCNDSLIASLLINGAEHLRLRANIYPGVLAGFRTPLGMFLALSDERDWIAGIHVSWPLGLAVSTR